MRRAALWSFAAAMVLGVAAVALTRWPIAPETAHAGMNDALGDGARLRWRTPSSASVSLLPWPRLTIEGAMLDDAVGLRVLSAREADFALDPGALVLGRLRPRMATLIGASLTLDLDRLPALAVSAAASGRDGAPPLPSLGLVDGTVRLVSARQDFETTLDGMDGRVDGLGVGRPLSLSFSARWRGEALTFAADVADPEAAGRGAPTSFSASLASAPLAASLRGRLWGGGEPGGEGAVRVEIKSFTALARLFETSRSRFLAADDVALRAEARAGRGGLELNDVKLTSAGQELEGALTLTLANGRAKVAGSLAADRLALAPLFGAPLGWREPGGAWSSQPFAFAPPRGADLDLRLSAVELDAFGQRFANVAASAIAGNGRLALALAEAAWAQGRLAGEARLERSGGPLAFAASGTLTGADLGDLFGGFGWRGNSGRGDFKASLEADGDSPAAMLDSVAGWATLGATDGAIAGIDLEEALRRSHRRPIDLPLDLRPGAAGFKRLDASIILAKGVATVASARLQGPSLAATGEGAIDLAGQTWRTRLAAQQTDAAGQPSADAARLTIDVEGPWAAPRATAARGVSD